MLSFSFQYHYNDFISYILTQFYIYYNYFDFSGDHTMKTKVPYGMKDYTIHGTELEPKM